MDTGKLGVWYFLDMMSGARSAEIAKQIESLGYGTLWIPEALGVHPFAGAAWILANTSKLNLATGIMNIYNREPGVTVAAQNTLAEQSGGRFLLGLGVSHVPLVEGVRGLTYGKPVATMRRYLEQMDQSLYLAQKPELPPQRVIAALGPRMLELARDQCAGAHPYFVTPDHTRMARDILGAEPMLCVEQKVILETDPVLARKVARQSAERYLALPNYRNNWLRMGFNESDLENGGSDQFIDKTIIWGDVGKIQAGIDAHFDAGASHVCIQPISSAGNFAEPDMNLLEQLAGRY